MTGAPRKSQREPHEMIHRSSRGKRFTLLHEIHIVRHLLHHLIARECALRIAIQRMINLREKPGVVVRLTPEHHAIKPVKFSLTFAERLDPAVHDKDTVREIRLQPRRKLTVKRRNIAVLFRGQPLQPRGSRAR